MATIYVEKDYSAMSEKSAELLISAWPQRGQLFGLATGESVKGLYACLAQAYQEGEISFQDRYTVNLDEVVGVMPSDPLSFWHFMHQELFRWVDIKPSNKFIPGGWPVTGDHLPKQCQATDEFIDKFGPVCCWILGIGTDGHFGYNFPGVRAHRKRTHVVPLPADYIRLNHLENTAIHRGITVGPKTVMSAQSLLQLASGEAKSQAVVAAVLGKINRFCPSSMFQKHGSWTLVLDKEAAAGILAYIRQQWSSVRELSATSTFFSVTSRSGCCSNVYLSQEVFEEFHW